MEFKFIFDPVRMRGTDTLFSVLFHVQYQPFTLSLSLYYLIYGIDIVVMAFLVIWSTAPAPWIAGQSSCCRWKPFVTFACVNFFIHTFVHNVRF